MISNIFLEKCKKDTQNTYVYSKKNVQIQFGQIFLAHLKHTGIMHTSQVVFVFLSFLIGHIAHLFLLDVSVFC